MPRHTLIRAEGLSEPISHYSDAVRVGDAIYVSGQASVDANAKLVGAGDVVAQTRQVLENMKIVLAAAGATLDDVVKVTVYLADCADRPRVNEVRKAYFKANKPRARSSASASSPSRACWSRSRRSRSRRRGSGRHRLTGRRGDD